MSAVCSDEVSSIRTRPASQTTTARHSSGSWRTSSSRQSTRTPTPGPRRSRSTTAGSVRSRGPVEHHEHVRDQAHLVAHQLGAGVDQRGQLGQPAADRVLLGAEQDGVGVDPGVRQPPDPAPPGLAVLVAEDRHPDVTRAVQQGDLRHQPVCERLTGVVLAGETDHAEPGQVEQPAPRRGGAPARPPRSWSGAPPRSRWPAGRSARPARR